MKVCAWCFGPIPASSRCDAVTCSKPCRQARHRFAVAPAGVVEGPPMRFAYADPPYPGLARRYYGCPEVDHVELVAHLEAEFPDGWALSTSGAAARQVWGLCPPDTRLAVFVRGERRVVSKRPRYAWEALFVRGGRSRLRAASESCGDVLDFRGRQHSHPGAVVGMKPAAFSVWLFGLLGAGLGDELVDLFPGSGAIGRAWAMFQGTEASWLEARRIEASQPADPSRGVGDASPRASAQPSWRTSATRRGDLDTTRRADLAPTSAATPRGEHDGRAARRDTSLAPTLRGYVVRCEACDGSGSRPHADGLGGSTCMPCEGTGWMRRASTLEHETHHTRARRRLGEVVG